MCVCVCVCVCVNAQLDIALLKKLKKYLKSLQEKE